MDSKNQTQKREIKFRAWNGEQMISPDYIDRNGQAHWYENSIPESTYNVMQFTGKKSTGIVQDVFEGDICTATFRDAKGVHELTGKIVMDEFMWCIETADDLYSLNRVTIIDVLGNIYEHSELLNL